MKFRHSNGYAAITVLVLVAMLFIGMYAVMNPFARIFTIFSEPKNATTYSTQELCEAGNKHWYNNACYEIDERARSVIFKERRIWLFAPLIFIIGLIFWYLTVTMKKDPYYFQQQPPGGGFQ